ncbi:MAG: chromosome partitioning protein ParB [Deltaproteobacteria bacterium]|nr:chromosome partitioning protein ParB [Deltaproteobacteria bacterium]
MNTKNLIREVDFHLLDLRYSHTRIKNKKAQLRMQNSINTYGQIIPALAIQERDKYVLVDGYLRFAALKACGHDCIKVQLVEEEPESLLTLLAKSDDRQMEAVEQAGLIQELHNRFSYSFTEIARRLGKDKGWVKRRLDLVESLPEEVLGAVINGRVSSWAASRVLVPLSRANEPDCLALTKKIIADPLSTRELVCLYDHYKKSSRTVRDRIISDPRLFTTTVKEQEQQKLGQQINDGPEGKWFKDISIVCHILKRLKATSDIMLDSHCRGRCQLWLSSAEKTIVELKEQAKRKSHDNPGIPADHS